MNIRAAFQNPDDFNFLLSPTLIMPAASALTRPQRVLRKWRRSQSDFEAWVPSLGRYSRDYITEMKALHTGMFETFGCLHGNVLDVGGGWGNYREWWRHGDDDVFIVHEPSLERLLCGPPEHYRDVYRDAYEKPVTFVADMAERMQYHDEFFDFAIMAEVLDHVADPEVVLEAVRRTLKPDGFLIVINHLSDDCPLQSPMYRTLRRLRRCMDSSPALLKMYANTLRPLVHMLLNRDHHLRSFSAESLRSLVKEPGFVESAHHLLSSTNQLALRSAKS